MPGGAIVAMAPLEIAARLRAYGVNNRARPLSEVFGPAGPSQTPTVPPGNLPPESIFA
jgi:hypothetical protein